MSMSETRGRRYWVWWSVGWTLEVIAVWGFFAQAGLRAAAPFRPDFVGTTESARELHHSVGVLGFGAFGLLVLGGGVLLGLWMACFGSRYWRPHAFKVGVAGVVWVIAIFTGLRAFHMFYDPPRRAALERATVAARPVITAIEQYKRDTGKYPIQLDELTIKYLSEVPSTGNLVYPHFAYSGPRDALGDSKDEQDAYQLSVFCHIGFNFDRLIYDPHNEWSHGKSFGNTIEPFAKGWVYFHD